MHVKISLIEPLQVAGESFMREWDHGELGAINENGVVFKRDINGEIRQYPMWAIASIRFDRD